MSQTKYVAGFDYTDAELLALFRECLARISVSGQRYEIAERVYEAADVPEVLKIIDNLQAKINSASGPIFGTLLARMVRP